MEAIAKLRELLAADARASERYRVMEALGEWHSDIAVACRSAGDELGDAAADALPLLLDVAEAAKGVSGDLRPASYRKGVVTHYFVHATTVVRIRRALARLEEAK